MREPGHRVQETPGHDNGQQGKQANPGVGPGPVPYRRKSCDSHIVPGLPKATVIFLFFEDGGQGVNRTPDTRIFSPLLYQLSYLAPLQRRY